MTVQGKISDAPVTLLIDSGASANFVARNFAKRAGLPVKFTAAQHIRLADKRELVSNEIVRNVKVTILINLTMLILFVFQN